MTTDVAKIESNGLMLYGVDRAPEEVLEEAHRAAAALKRVIDAKPKKVQFSGETYLEFEDWQTVAKFYGIAVRITTTKRVEYGTVTGWEATAEAVHVASTKVVATAESMCLDDEEHWKSRPKYDWLYVKRSGGTSTTDPGKDEIIWERGRDGKNRPKKVKEFVGLDPVPEFQRRSMAQTRAGAKALRNALAWVVVLAGYRPTPAEEMPHRPDDDIVDGEIARGPVVDLGNAPEVDDNRQKIYQELMDVAGELGLTLASLTVRAKRDHGITDLDKADAAVLGDLVARLKERRQA